MAPVPDTTIGSHPKTRAARPGVLRLALGIWLVALSSLMFEITITRIFSVTLLYHFASFTISMALLGITASGVGASAIGSRLRKNLATSLTMLDWGYAFAIVVTGTLLLALRIPGLNLYEGLTQPLQLYLLIAAILTALPFFLSGLIIVLCLIDRARQGGTLYFADLVGAGLGAFLVAPVLNWVGGPGSIFIIASLAALGSLAFSIALANFFRVGSMVVFLLQLLLLGLQLQRGLLEVRVVKGMQEAPKLFEQWNAFSRVAVTKESDAVYNISIDAGAATPLFTSEVVQHALADPNASMRQAVYRLQTDARVLVIGPGGGFDIASARYYGHRQITGVEINPIIIHLVRERFQSFTGNLYGQEGVQIVHDEGRSFVRRSHERYDIIQLTLVDTWAATGAGWLALSENTLYTAEAFEDYLRHITEGGMVSVNRWMFPGADRETLRVVSLGIEALRQLGIPEPAQHFLV
jgi:spermidine synthase